MSCSKGRDGRLLPTITACRDSLRDKPSGSGTLLAALRDAPEVVVVLQALVALLAIAGYWRVYHAFERDQVLIYATIERRGEDAHARRNGHVGQEEALR